MALLLVGMAEEEEEESLGGVRPTRFEVGLGGVWLDTAVLMRRLLVFVVAVDEVVSRAVI